MKFTDYVVTEAAGNSVDPLGYLRPSGEVSGALFRQFTVLSNHPAYQGFLAFAFGYLAGRSIRPGQREFSRRIRDLEILWGVLNVRAGDSVVNVTKFEPLTHADAFRLNEVRRRPALYARLNYGVLGHYSSPSAFWRIIEPKGIGLTPLGSELGEAWRYRARQDFAALADRWMNDQDLYSIDGLDRWGETYHLTAAPEKSEQKVWQALIDGICARDHVIAPIWRSPVPDHNRHTEGIHSVLLADEVGMGKTYAALATIAMHIFQTRANNRKALLIVPNALLSSKWEQEIRTFNRDYLVRKGGKELRPLVVGGYWDLVQNLHDYDNIDVPRISERMTVLRASIFAASRVKFFRRSSMMHGRDSEA